MYTHNLVVYGLHIIIKKMLYVWLLSFKYTFQSTFWQSTIIPWTVSLNVKFNCFMFLDQSLCPILFLSILSMGYQGFLVIHPWLCLRDLGIELGGRDDIREHYNYCSNSKQSCTYSLGCSKVSSKYFLYLWSTPSQQAMHTPRGSGLVYKAVTAGFSSAFESSCL